ncbi:MAG: hemolysin family protein [Sphingomonadaceae bacterium]|uniref:hemolysin family protein n=1 Tax=Thermaurantiacus sp. TaxID=2820283 RepID=UPI00298EEDD4|nr:hemolysin family protein [Thermaurantiacus sp.]MCS6987387.1 hemolysin family protein [Sphingomonadaceae bacterium]MDW8415307.1 hemolysin family protein [Thermaurantiacus sp.]
MPAFPWVDLGLVLLLILVNGAFAAAELAIVSARRARLQLLERAGVRGAATAIRLQEAQGRFLSAVQVGITLVGIGSGAFSAAVLGGPVARGLMAWGVPAGLAGPLGLALVVLVVTYLSLVAGELVPKQLALRSPERLACWTAPPMAALTRLFGPVVALLDASTAAVFALLGLKRERDAGVTEEELRTVVAEAESAGVIEEDERELITGIMRMADRRVRGVMTPRVDVDWIDADADWETLRAHLMRTPHTRLVVAEGSVDRAVGIVQARDLLAAVLAGGPVALRELMRKPPVVPDVADATAVLAALRDSDVPMAFVVDEYGHFEGVVTPSDLLAAIAGEFASDLDEGEEPAIVEREDGSLLVSGSLAADELAERLGFRLDEERDYQTVAGFVLAELEHIPATGEHFDAHGFRFEVVDMDGRKIDRLLVRRLPAD